VLENAPKLFDRVPRGLFGPLGGAHAELYWELLASLYQHEFEREPFNVAKPVALEIAERVIRDSRLWIEGGYELGALGQEDPAEEESNGHAPTDGTKIVSVRYGDEPDVLRSAARRILTRVERSGWIHFQYRAGLGEIMSFHPYAARILEKLFSVAKDEQPIFQGFVHSIAALLEPKAFAQRPGVSLSEAKRRTLDLMRELKILERNIHRLTQSVLDEAETAAAVLEEGLDRYENAVMANYHRLKTVDNVFRQRSAILGRLDAIKHDESLLQAAAEWYADQFNCGIREARVAIAMDLDTLHSQFEAIPRFVDEIDFRNARFSGVALRKIRYLLRQDRRTEGQLQFIVDALARGDGPELEFDMYKCELLNDGFLYTPRTVRPQLRPQVFVRPEAQDHEQLQREAVARLQKMFGRRKIEEFVDTLLAGRTSATLGEIPVTGDDDYVRLFYLAAHGLDRGSNFTLHPSSDRIRKGDYTHPGGWVEKSASNKQNGTTWQSAAHSRKK